MQDLSAEQMAARIADCLELHLHELGWEPYRYPSGEHKGVEFERKTLTVVLASADGTVFDFVVRERPTDRKS